VETVRITVSDGIGTGWVDVKVTVRTGGSDNPLELFGDMYFMGFLIAALIIVAVAVAVYIASRKRKGGAGEDPAKGKVKEEPVKGKKNEDPGKDKKADVPVEDPAKGGGNDGVKTREPGKHTDTITPKTPG
jgi:hypothetical protein